MPKPLLKSFYKQNTLKVAKELLGCTIKHKNMLGKIVETESYLQNDPGSHSSIGQTKRNKTMFGPPGHLYVYFTYGMHYCANIVTKKKGVGCAVLIRALEPIKNLQNTNGPARFTKAMGINKDFDGENLVTGRIKIYPPDGRVYPKNIIQTTRIGISKSQDLPYRFYIKGNKFVSKK